MKNTLKLFSLLSLLLIFSLVFTACSPVGGGAGGSSSADGMGQISIRVGSSNADRAIWQIDGVLCNTDDFTHKVTVSGGPGQAQSVTILPHTTGKANFIVKPGNWTITVVASLDEEMKEVVATASEPVTIKAGENNFSITMNAAGDLVIDDPNNFLGTIDVIINNSNVLYSDAETPNIEYVVTLTGATPKPPIRFAKGTSPEAFSVAVGTWNVKVDALIDDILRATVESPVPVNVEAGKNTTAQIEMYSATEVADFYHLDAAITSSSPGTSRKEIIIVKKPISLQGAITIPRPIELRGESGAVISRGVNTALFIVSGGTLELKGPLTIDGTGTATGSLISVQSGELIMHDGVVLQNNNTTAIGGAVTLQGGTFTMYGGTIRNNKADGGGGGVNILSSVAQFTMYGGEIIGNDGGMQQGGGVFMGGGIFTMSGGTITKNISGNNGGGVYANSSAKFTMSGGSITENTGSNGGGVAFVSGSIFTMEDGTITTNTATNAGGGVYINDDCTFIKTKGIITGIDSVNGNKDGNNGSALCVGGSANIYIDTTITGSYNYP